MCPYMFIYISTCDIQAIDIFSLKTVRFVFCTYPHAFLIQLKNVLLKVWNFKLTVKYFQWFSVEIRIKPILLNVVPCKNACLTLGFQIYLFLA